MLKSLPLSAGRNGAVRFATSSTVQAQDFRIYTRVFDDSPAALALQKNDPNSRSENHRPLSVTLSCRKDLRLHGIGG